MPDRRPSLVMGGPLEVGLITSLRELSPDTEGHNLA